MLHRGARRARQGHDDRAVRDALETRDDFRDRRARWTRAKCEKRRSASAAAVLAYAAARTCPGGADGADLPCGYASHRASLSPRMIAIPERGIYLASRSPRRRELLAQIGVRYHLLLFRERLGEHPEVDETPLAGEAPAAYVERMARAKAEAGWRRMLQRNLPPAPILAADTTVALEGRLFGKPKDRAQAAEMLAALSGQRHEVLTAVALKNYDEMEFALSSSEVQLKKLSPEEIAQYAASGEGDDKAGAYAIQGRAGRFVVELRGSYSGVMGLPLYETSLLLDKLRGRNTH